MSNLTLPPIIPNLPDDISVQCIALLPLSSHPFLSLVSRSWRSLLRSHLLLSLRSHLDCTEPVLFISIRTPTNLCKCFLFRPSLPHNPQPIPPPPFASTGSACCTLGSDICLLGGSNNCVPTRTLQIFSYHTKEWSIGPYMSATREFAAAESIDGRIYVVGGCLPSTPSWAETLDSSGCCWVPISSPVHLRDKWMHGNAVLDGKLLAVADRGGVLFDPKTLTWGPASMTLDLGWKGRAAVVDGILYSYDYLGKIRGYDPVTDEWRQVEGVSRKLPKFLCGATLSNLGGLLCLVWEGYSVGEMPISCAGIKISKMEDGGLRGSVKWFASSVLEVPRGSWIAHCVSIEL